MSITVKIEGLEELRARFTNLDRKFDDAVADAIEDTILQIRTEVIKGLQRGPASGRVYKKSNPKRTHQASAPGQPPMSDTGRLVGSIYMDIRPTSATVGSRLAYAHYLEFGTRKMAPRPIWMPVVERESRKVKERIEANLRAVT